MNPYYNIPLNSSHYISNNHPQSPNLNSTHYLLPPPQPPQQLAPPPPSHHPQPYSLSPTPQLRLQQKHPYDPRNVPYNSHTVNSEIHHPISRQSSHVPFRNTPHSSTEEFDGVNGLDIPARGLLESRVYSQQFDERVASQNWHTDKFRRTLDDNSRSTNELDAKTTRNNLKDESYGVRQFVSGSHRSYGDAEVITRRYESNLGHHEKRSCSGFDHEVTRSIAIDTQHSPLKRSEDYIYNYDDSKEGTHELSRPMRKQVRKKRALLRIQMPKPNCRSREDERTQYMNGFKEYMRKDSLAYSARRVESKEIERIPMELDVSFKSNSLVAKEIVAPFSSSNDIIKGLNTTQKFDYGICNRKEKCIVSEKSKGLVWTNPRPDNDFVNTQENCHGADDDISRKQYKKKVKKSFKNPSLASQPIVIIDCEEIMANTFIKTEVLTSKSDLCSLIQTDMSIRSADVDCFANADTTFSLFVKNSCIDAGPDSGRGCMDIRITEPELSLKSGFGVASDATSLDIEEKVTVPACCHEMSNPVSINGISTVDIQNSGLASSSSFSEAKNVLSDANIQLPPCLEKTNPVLETSTRGSTDSSVRDVSKSDGPISDQSIDLSCSVSKDLKIPGSLSIFAPCLGGEHTLTSVPTMVDNNVGKNDALHFGNEYHVGEKRDRPDVDEVVTCGEIGKSMFPIEYESSAKNEAPSVSEDVLLVVDRCGVPKYDQRDCGTNKSCNMGSQKEMTGNVCMETSNIKPLDGQVSDKMFCEDKLLDKLGSKSGSKLVTTKLGSQYGKVSSWDDRSFIGKVGVLAVKSSNDNHSTPNSKSKQTHQEKKIINDAIPRSFARSSSYVFNTPKRTVYSSANLTKTRTWHRASSVCGSPLAGNRALSNSYSPQEQFPKKSLVLQTSYIRKGNSLLRRPSSDTVISRGCLGLTSSSVNQVQSSGIDELKNMKFESRVDAMNPSNIMKAGINAHIERHRTLPLPSMNKVPDHGINCLGECASSPLKEPLASLRSIETDTSNSYENALKISEIHVEPVNKLETHCEHNEVNVASKSEKKITYVKRKSDQLVATLEDSPNKTQGHAYERFHKKRKNELVRISMDSHRNHTGSFIDDTMNPEGQPAPNNIASRTYQRHYNQVVKKPFKHSKWSSVWTPDGNQLSNRYGDSSHHQNVLRQLFPWKRSTRRSFIRTSNSRNSLLSKLRSKVLSVGGSNFNWSKSIDRDLKRANEEDALEAEAVEKKQREQYNTGSNALETKSTHHSSRERIFRIGSVRYKMDSSRRTLLRMSDDGSTSTAALVSETTKSYVPKRLVIDNDDYVRVGNGNQLIRDPKKRIRLLASEKVRRCLHSARSRLARKQKYCQFFTRFGKCNKNDGKCPYIHDSSKVSVCTKFLNGLCSNPDCKLTHKVIPERMPDCSYFLQGLCTNPSCPYRHVHVNSNASSCEWFLRGYCTDGNECRKKHSYLCLVYEATGSCPQGSKCKRHHPKKQSKEKRKQQSQSRQPKKTQRHSYFGSSHTDVSGPEAMVTTEQHIVRDTNLVDKLWDYISLDQSDKEGEDSTFVDNDPSDLQCDDLDKIMKPDLRFDDLDELIKPIRIMNRIVLTT